MTTVKAKSGLILLDKPAGITSFKVLSVIKNTLKINKVGHAGTLDKFATGLLLILTGHYTRLVPYFTNLDKEYVATVRFGTETTTLDPEGEVVRTGPFPVRKEIDAVLEQFRGEIRQVPPDYSAVHLQGKRAYELASQGLKPELPARNVHIYELEVLSYTAPDLTLRIHCSKGTYIRALARDLGHACGSCAFLTTLRRTVSGSFNVADAVAPEDFNPEADLREARNFLTLLNGFRLQTVPPYLERQILQGRCLEAGCLGEDDGDGAKVALFAEDGRLLALAEYTSSPAKTKSYRYLAVFNRQDD